MDSNVQGPLGVFKKVLVVDDSSTVRAQVREALSAAGFDVYEARDGVEGLALINSLVDLAAIVCDVSMPKLGGIEMIETIEKLLTTSGRTTPPIVMLTTEGRGELVQRAKRAGAKAWLVKPFKPELLLAAIHKLTAV